MGTHLSPQTCCLWLGRVGSFEPRKKCSSGSLSTTWSTRVTKIPSSSTPGSLGTSSFLLSKNWLPGCGSHSLSPPLRDDCLPLHFFPAFMLSCNFPRRPDYGDVMVMDLHSGGVAHFHCHLGYELQGAKTLTCINASKPHWSSQEPICSGTCQPQPDQTRMVHLRGERPAPRVWRLTLGKRFLQIQMAAAI